MISLVLPRKHRVMQEKANITIETNSFLALDRNLGNKKASRLDIFNMFCEGLFLRYRFRVEHYAILFTCRLGYKSMKFIETQNIQGLLLR